jgi:hypothetical protein
MIKMILEVANWLSSSKSHLYKHHARICMIYNNFKALNIVIAILGTIKSIKSHEISMYKYRQNTLSSSNSLKLKWCKSLHN